MARRRFSTFNLSFLDIMSCGFGAVALIFLIIKHDIDKRQQLTPNDLQAEINLLHEDIQTAEELKVRAKNTLSELDQELVQAQGLARRINNDIEATRSRLDALSETDDAAVEQLRKEIQRLQERKQILEEEAVQG
ncbi:MAG: VWA domain-containing protein, partial [Cellvibrionaceae bacterium]|nr:VWA domain-containing protein [Cellvibrionaceae bacterium]